MSWSGDRAPAPVRPAHGGLIGRTAVVAGVLVAAAVLSVVLIVVFGPGRRPAGDPTTVPSVALTTRVSPERPGGNGSGSGSGSGGDPRPGGAAASVWSSDAAASTAAGLGAGIGAGTDAGAAVGSGGGGGSAAAAWQSGWAPAASGRAPAPVPVQGTDAASVERSGAAPAGRPAAPARRPAPNRAPRTTGSTPAPAHGGIRSSLDESARAPANGTGPSDTGPSEAASSDAAPADPGPADQGPTEAGSPRLFCTKEVDNLGELHDVMINSGPDDIVCVRGPQTRPAALSAVAFARSQLGEPYRWGGNSRADGGFDCSGLTSASYASAGVPIPRTAQAQYNAGHHVPAQQIRAGDLVFFGSGPRGVRHVGMAISPTQMINAPDEGQVVSIGPIQRHDFVGATRPVRTQADDPGVSASSGSDSSDGSGADGSGSDGSGSDGSDGSGSDGSGAEGSGGSDSSALAASGTGQPTPGS